jgi:peptide/nickel transport system ATP-binding protein
MVTNASKTDRKSWTDDAIIEVNNARVTFSMDRGESRVLNDVSINIEREEILGIVGESGSGKSMFADSLLDAIVEPGVLSGDITYHPSDRQPVNLLDLDQDGLKQVRWEEISMVFQGAMSSFNPTMSIKSQFKETLKAHDYDIEEGMERGRQLLSDLYLDPDRTLDS